MFVDKGDGLDLLLLPFGPAAFASMDTYGALT